MKGLIFLILILGLTGCARINPRMDQKIDNQGGQIDEIKSNQNGLMLEIGKLRQNSDIHDSNIKEFQQGMLNLNAAISKNENSGIQILQGDGALILVFGVIVVGMVLYHYRDRAITSEKTSDILAREVIRFNDPNLNDGILKAAMYTTAEKKVFHLLTKHSIDNS